MERFGNDETRLIHDGDSTKATRRVVPQALHEKAQGRIAFVLQVGSPSDCAVYSGFKMLHGTLRGTYQFQIGGPYRLRFDWDGTEAINIRVGDFHDED